MVIGDDIGMETEDIIETLRKKFARVAPVLDERGRRVWAAAEAEALGYGGQGLVAKATGLARTTLYREGVDSKRIDHDGVTDTVAAEAWLVMGAAAAVAGSPRLTRGLKGQNASTLPGIFPNNHLELTH